MFNTQDVIEVTILPEEIRLSVTIQHTEGQHLLFSVNAIDASLFQPNINLQFIQAEEGGLYLCEATVINRRDNLVVAKIGRPQLMQRRRSKRFVCDLAAYYQNGRSLADLSLLQNDQMSVARVCDLSLGGAQVYVSKILFAQTTLGMRICLEDSGKINVEASVIRCRKAENLVAVEELELPNLIAIRFCSVSRFDQVQLHRYLTSQD